MVKTTFFNNVKFYYISMSPQRLLVIKEIMENKVTLDILGGTPEQLIVINPHGEGVIYVR